MQTIIEIIVGLLGSLVMLLIGIYIGKTWGSLEYFIIAVLDYMRKNIKK